VRASEESGGYRARIDEEPARAHLRPSAPYDPALKRYSWGDEEPYAGGSWVPELVVWHRISPGPFGRGPLDALADIA
jgi:hypothetical protein